MKINTETSDALKVVQELAGLKIAEIRTKRKSENIATEIGMIYAIANLAEKEDVDPGVIFSFISRLNPASRDFDIIKQSLEYGDHDIIRAAVMVEDSLGHNGLARAKENDKDLHDELSDPEKFPQGFFSSKTNEKDATESGSVKVRDKVAHFEKIIISQNSGTSL